MLSLCHYGQTREHYSFTWRKFVSRNYWGYRIDKRNIQFFRKKLEQGRLHQGWGKKPEQALTNPDLRMV